MVCRAITCSVLPPPTAFDQQINFDARFSVVGDIGAFRFSQLALLGTPASISTANGPTNLALIADGGITDGTAASANTQPVIDLGGLGNVLLATRNGAITFTQGITFQNTDGTAPNLTLYARGGALDLENTTRFALGGALELDSDTGITLNAQAGSTTAAGANTINVVSGGALTIGGSVFASGAFTAATTTAGGATPGGDFTLASGASFGSISGTATVTATGAVTLNGMASAGGALGFTAGGSLTTSAASSLQGTGGAALSSTGAMTLGGSLTAAGNVTLFSTGDMNLNGPITLSAGLFSAQSAGAVNITGAIAGNPTVGSVDGSVAGGRFSVQGGSITVAVGGSISAGGDVQQASSLDATGTLVINGRVDDGGGRLQLTSGGALTVGPDNTIVSNAATITSGGAVTLDLGVFLKGDPTRSNSVNILGLSAALSNSGVPGSIGTLDVTTGGPITLAAGIYRFDVLQTKNADTSSLPGNLTIAPDATVTDRVLVLGGDWNLGDGVSFTLAPGSAANSPSQVGGNIILSGTPLLSISQPLTIAGNIKVSDPGDTPALSVASGDSFLTTTGNVNLGAGSLTGGPGSTTNTGGTFTTTGSVRMGNLNTTGDFSAGSLSAGLMTSDHLDGTLNTANPATVISGAVTPLVPGGTHSFDLGSFAADGGLQFSGSTAAGGSLDAASLTLNVRTDLTFGPNGTAGQSVVTARFDGSDSTTDDAPAAGRGGSLAVTTSPAGFSNLNAVTGSINIQTTAGPSPSPSASPSPTPSLGSPVLTAVGGTATRGPSGAGGSGGAGGTLSFSTGNLSISSGATLDVSGGDFTDGTDPATPTGMIAASGGAGGNITLNANLLMTISGSTGTGTDGLVTLQANGGSVNTTDTNTAPGAGGVISIASGGDFAMSNTQVLASGGGVAGGFSFSSVRTNAATPVASGGGSGGRISLTSSGTDTDASDILIRSSSLTAATGVNGSALYGGTGGQITIMSGDLSNQAAGGTPAIYLTGATAVVGNDESTASTAATAQGGTITVTSARVGGPGIFVGDSSELRALVSGFSQGAGGSVTLQTNGANVEVNNSTIRASGTGSQVFLNTANNSPAQDSQIILTDATLSADVLKVQALGLNGTLTIGGSSTLTGNTQLLLYAGTGSGTGSLIEFVASTTLNSNVAGVLAAYTVKIDNGMQVTVNGPALNLYATSLQFSTASGGDGSTTGSFAGSGATKVGNYGDPGTPTPSAAASPNSKSATKTAPATTRRPVASTGRSGRPVTLPFEAVQPFLVRGGPALPTRLNSLAANRKVPAIPVPVAHGEPTHAEGVRPVVPR